MRRDRRVFWRCDGCRVVVLGQLSLRRTGMARERERTGAVAHPVLAVRVGALGRTAVLEREAELGIEDERELALALDRGEEVVGGVALRGGRDVEEARRERWLRGGEEGQLWSGRGGGWL